MSWRDRIRLSGFLSDSLLFQRERDRDFGGGVCRVAGVIGRGNPFRHGLDQTDRLLLKVRVYHALDLDVAYGAVGFHREYHSHYAFNSVLPGHFRIFQIFYNILRESLLASGKFSLCGSRGRERYCRGHNDGQYRFFHISIIILYFSSSSFKKWTLLSAQAGRAWSEQPSSSMSRTSWKPAGPS